MLIGARLNWLLAHGKGPHWSPTMRFVQVDISPTEIDSNRPIAAPVVADIGSAMSAFLAMVKPGQIQPKAAWLDAIAERKQHNIERFAVHLNASPNPMNFYSALRATAMSSPTSRTSTSSMKGPTRSIPVATSSTCTNLANVSTAERGG
jgi:oxalyl-CoA decarboxylase